MKISEIKAMADGVAPVVRDLLDKATAPLIAENKVLLARLDALEKRLDDMPTPKDGRDGSDGKSVTVEDVAPLIVQEVEKAVAAIPAAKDGEDGQNGKDADPDAVATLVHERIKGQLDAMQEAVNSIPPAPELPDIPAMIEEAVAEAVKAIPVPRDGAPGAKGDPGRDGLDVKDLFRADGGRLIAVMSDGTTKDLGEFVGADGKDGAPGRDGKDGADGLGFEDLTFDADEAGRPIAKFQRGDVVKTIALPCIIDRGTFSAGTAYHKGDAVSWGGSLWIAQKDAPAGKPGEGEDFRLAVKKGRDGRDTEAKKVL